jgi:two-component system, cell cycle sensor histidine kinase and response regulator CckA
MLRKQAGEGEADERSQLLGELEDLLGRLASLQEQGAVGDGLVELSSASEFDLPVTWTTDRELRYTSASGSLAGGGGEPADALVGRSLWECLGTDDPNHPVLRHHRQALEGDTVFFRLKRADRRWFNHIAPVRGRDGRVVGTIGFAFDVGSPGDDWAARRASARRYRVVVSSAPVGVAVLSLDGQVLECNPALARIFDHSPEEIRKRGVAGLSHPEDLLLDVRLFGDLVEGKRDRYQIEKRYFRRDGALLWCNLTVSLVRGDSGVPELVIAVVEDVTERKETHEALRQSEARFRSVYESGLLGIFFFNGDLVIDDANDAFLRMVGYDRRALTSVGWTLITPREFRARDEQALAELRQDGICAPFEKEYTRMDGTRVPVIVSGAFLDEEKSRGVACVLDVSEKRRLEAQFQQAQRLDILGRVAGGVAHDFNNIVTAVLANTELVKDALEPTHPAQSDLAEIHEAGRRAAYLTRQLLAFGRAQIMQPQVLDIDELVRRVEVLLHRVIREDIELVTDLGAAGARASADPGELERALVNLVVNARDAIEGHGRILIQTRRLATVDPRAIRGDANLRGPCVLIRVCDTGEGMDADTLARIFEPFFTTKEPGRGTGLGLSIVYGVVQQSGGGLRVESTPGTGTAFEILLPESPGQASEAPEPTPAPNVGGGSETILVAEDDPMVFTVAIKILRGQGYRVIAARDPAEALAASAAHREPLHLLLSDLVMPGMSGVDLAARVRSLHPETKVLYMSGYAGNTLSSAGHRPTDAPVLTKPFTQNELAVKVREILLPSGAPEKPSA